MSFVFMVCPLRCFALFPYTTLFRSAAGLGGRERARVFTALAKRGVCGRLGAARARRVFNRAGHVAGDCHRQPANRARDRDRKSTRLNSSHLVISYAVFCLKKKKQTI